MEGSYSWHVADGNEHFNLHGNALTAAAVAASIQAQPGWLAALSLAGAVRHMNRLLSG